MIKAILLAATVPFMTQHRNILPKTEISTNFYGSVTGIVDQTYIEAHGGGGGRGGITTNNVEDIAYVVSTNVVTNVVTKTFVEGLGISAGSTTNDIKALINDEVGGTNNIAHIDGSVLNDRLAMFNIHGKIEDSGLVVGDVATVDGSTYGGRFLCFKDSSNEIIETISTNNVMMKPSYIDFYDDNNWSQITLFTNNGQYENPRSNWGIFGLNFWDANGLITTYGSSITHGSYTYQFPSWSGTLALQSEVNSKVPNTRKVNNKELSSDITLQASDVGAASTQDLEATQAIVQTWEGFLDGSNVVFSITNYVSGSYNLNTAKLRIMEMTNGVYREVYNSRDEIVMHIDNFRTNDFRVATNSVITSVDTKIAGKADKAWGKYTSTGTEIAGIGYSNTVYMTEPTTVFAGGMEYARFAVGEGSICVLTTKGAPVYTTGDEGTFKFQDNGGTNYFGFAKTDSYTIGANASGISVQNQIVTITYDVSMSGVPCIWYIGSLENYDPTAWEQLNTPDGQPIAGASHIVQWEQNPPEGKRICYINCPEPKGFFKATIEVAGDAKFVTNMPADLAGGILATNQTLNVIQSVEPYISNGQVLWRVKP